MMHEFSETLTFICYVYLGPQQNFHTYIQFKNYSRMAKIEVCYIYYFEHITHNKSVNIACQLFDIWAYKPLLTNSTFFDGVK